MSNKDELMLYMKKEIKRLKEELDQIDQQEQVDELYAHPSIQEVIVKKDKRIEKLEQYFKDILSIIRQSSSLKMTVASIEDVCVIALGKPGVGDFNTYEKLRSRIKDLELRLRSIKQVISDTPHTVGDRKGTLMRICDDAFTEEGGEINASNST